MVTLVAILTAQPGKEAELAEVCAQLAKEVLFREEGCLMYIPHVAKNDPSEITFFEKYKDQQAFKAHGETVYFQEAAKKFKNLLTGPFQVKFLSEL